MMPGQMALMRMLSGRSRGRRIGETDDAELGGAVGGAAREALDPGARGGVDDRAAAVLEQERDLVLHAQEDAREVDVDDPVPVVFGDVGGRCGAEFDAGVVERDVETAERVDPGQARP